MKKGINLLEQFDQLTPLEPTAEWSDQLLERISQSDSKSYDLQSRRLFYLVVAFLLAANALSLTRSWLNDRSQQNSMDLKTLASEYLISTNSAKF